MGSGVDQALVRDLSRVVVERVAPAELPSFRVLSDAYFARPERPLVAGGGDGGPLDFGPGEVVALLSPVVLAAMSDVVQDLVKDLTRKGAKAGARAVRRLFRIGGKEDDGEPAVTLSAEEWAGVRQAVLEAVRRKGVPDEVAARIADAVLDAGQCEE